MLAGLFFVMGVQALEANGITLKMLFLARDRHLTPRADPLTRVERRKAVWVFVALELVGFGATFAITQTIAAIGFPVFILLYIPLRTWGLPRWFSAHELSVLDAPTASPFTMESVGGNHGEAGQGQMPGFDEVGAVLDESDEAEEAEKNGAKTANGKRVWTKEKPKSAKAKPKKKKEKFRYESKAERKFTREKQRSKNRAQAERRKGKK